MIVHYFFLCTRGNDLLFSLGSKFNWKNKPHIQSQYGLTLFVSGGTHLIMCCQLAHFICFFGNAYLLFDSVWCHHSSILLTTVVLAMKIHSTNWLRMNPWFFSSLSDHREFGSSVSSNFFHTSPNFSILSSYFKSFQLMVFWTRVQPQIRIWSSQVSFFFSPMWDSSF